MRNLKSHSSCKQPFLILKYLRGGESSRHRDKKSQMYSFHFSVYRPKDNKSTSFEFHQWPKCL